MADLRKRFVSGLSNQDLSTMQYMNRMAVTNTIPQNLGGISSVLSIDPNEVVTPFTGTRPFPELNPMFMEQLRTPANLVTRIAMNVHERMIQSGSNPNETPLQSFSAFGSKYATNPSANSAMEFANRNANLLYHGFGPYLLPEEKLMLELFFPYSTNKEEQAKPVTHTLQRRFTEDAK